MVPQVFSVSVSVVNVRGLFRVKGGTLVTVVVREKHRNRGYVKCKQVSRSSSCSSARKSGSLIGKWRRDTEHVTVTVILEREQRSPYTTFIYSIYTKGIQSSPSL